MDSRPRRYLDLSSITARREKRDPRSKPQNRIRPPKPRSDNSEFNDMRRTPGYHQV